MPINRRNNVSPISRNVLIGSEEFFIWFVSSKNIKSPEKEDWKVEGWKVGRCRYVCLQVTKVIISKSVTTFPVSCNCKKSHCFAPKRPLTLFWPDSVNGPRFLSFQKHCLHQNTTNANMIINPPQENPAALELRENCFNRTDECCKDATFSPEVTCLHHDVSIRHCREDNFLFSLGPTPQSTTVVLNC